ncbi:hypothetical protein BH18THE2_BH18THE2_24620 [soil metagenome]
MNSELLYDRKEEPFGKSWEEWVIKWCRWLLSIPKRINPCLDLTGKYCSVNQYEKDVWFLAGTFGNIFRVTRHCTVPDGKSVFFPILVKEDSFIEDTDLKTEVELIRRCRDATARVISMEATLDGTVVAHLENYRVQSSVFDLIFPEENIYDVKPGQTRSVCDGFWLFMKPLETGKHTVNFKGETSIVEPYIESRMRSNEAYSTIREHIYKNRSFILDISYELNVVAADLK